MWQFLPPPCRLQSATLAARHRWRHYITTVTAATNTIAPSPPVSLPRLRPPPRRQLAGCPPLLSPARGRTRGTARACAASGRHSWWSVGQADGGLWWTGSMKHPRRWRAFFTISALRPSTGQRLWFVGAVVLWQWCGSTTRPWCAS